MRRISPSPGKKARMPPSVSFAAWMIRSAMAFSNCGPCVFSFAQGLDRKRGSTGKERPLEVITGAFPISLATAAESSVADMTIRCRSGRSASRTSNVNARPVSDCRLRSWNSSKMTQPTPLSSGSDWIMRVNMPSVITSIRVPLLDLLSPRIR